MKYLLRCAFLTIAIFGFQSASISAQISVEPSKKTSPVVKQQEKATTQLEMQTLEVRNNKQACQEYCRNTEKKCICDKRACATGWKVAKRWSGIDDDWVACVEMKYSR